MVEAWFPDGKDSADVALLLVESDSAEYWDTPGGRIASALAFVEDEAHRRAAQRAQRHRRPLRDHRSRSRSRRPAAIPAMVSASTEPPEALGQPDPSHGGEPESQVHPRAGGGRGEGDRPRELHPAALRAVDQVSRGFDLHGLEVRLRSAVVGDPLTDREPLPARQDRPRRAASLRHEPLRRPREVPAAARLAQLDEPGPHQLGGGRHVEPAIHHDVGVRHQVVARSGDDGLGSRWPPPPRRGSSRMTSCCMRLRVGPPVDRDVPSRLACPGRTVTIPGNAESCPSRGAQPEQFGQEWGTHRFHVRPGRSLTRTCSG